MTPTEKFQEALCMLDKNATVKDIPLNNGIFGAIEVTVHGITEYFEGDTCLLDAAKEWKHAIEHKIYEDAAKVGSYDVLRFTHNKNLRSYTDFLDFLFPEIPSA